MAHLLQPSRSWAGPSAQTPVPSVPARQTRWCGSQTARARSHAPAGGQRHRWGRHDKDAMLQHQSRGRCQLQNSQMGNIWQQPPQQQSQTPGPLHGPGPSTGAGPQAQRQQNYQQHHRRQHQPHQRHPPTSLALRTMYASSGSSMKRTGGLSSAWKCLSDMKRRYAWPKEPSGRPSHRTMVSSCM